MRFLRRNGDHFENTCILFPKFQFFLLLYGPNNIRGTKYVKINSVTICSRSNPILDYMV